MTGTRKSDSGAWGMWLWARGPCGASRPSAVPRAKLVGMVPAAFKETSRHGVLFLKQKILLCCLGLCWTPGLE